MNNKKRPKMPHLICLLAFVCLPVRLSAPSRLLPYTALHPLHRPTPPTLPHISPLSSFSAIGRAISAVSDRLADPVDLNWAKIDPNWIAIWLNWTAIDLHSLEFITDNWLDVNLKLSWNDRLTVKWPKFSRIRSDFPWNWWNFRQKWMNWDRNL